MKRVRPGLRIVRRAVENEHISGKSAGIERKTYTISQD